MFTRMMYSCLVDADFLDTEEFMTEGKAGRQQGQKMPELLDKLEKYIEEWMKNTEKESVNGRRTEILKACLERRRERKRTFSVNGSHRWRKNCCIACFCVATCSETSYGSCDLCDTIHQYY